MSRSEQETSIQPDGGLLSIVGDLLFACVILVALSPLINKTINCLNRQFFWQACYTFQIMLGAAALAFVLLLLVAQQLRVTYCSFVRPYVGDPHTDTAQLLLKLMVATLLIANILFSRYLPRMLRGFVAHFQSGRETYRTSADLQRYHSSRHLRHQSHYSTRTTSNNNNLERTQTESSQRLDPLAASVSTTRCSVECRIIRSQPAQRQTWCRDVGTMVRFPERSNSLSSSTYSLQLGRRIEDGTGAQGSGSLCCLQPSPLPSSSSLLHQSPRAPSQGFGTGTRSAFQPVGTVSRPGDNTGFHNVQPENGLQTSEVADSRRSSLQAPETGRPVITQSEQPAAARRVTPPQVTQRVVVEPRSNGGQNDVVPDTSSESSGPTTQICGTPCYGWPSCVPNWYLPPEGGCGKRSVSRDCSCHNCQQSPSGRGSPTRGRRAPRAKGCKEMGKGKRGKQDSPCCGYPRPRGSGQPFHCPQQSLCPPPLCYHGSSLNFCTPPQWPSRRGSCTSPPFPGARGRPKFKVCCGGEGQGKRGKSKKKPACPRSFVQQFGLPPEVTRWFNGAVPSLWPPCSRRSSCQSVGTPRDPCPPPTLCLTWGLPLPLGPFPPCPTQHACFRDAAACRRGVLSLPKCTRSGKIYG